MTLKSEMECQESTNNSPSKILILTTNRMTIARCFVLSLSYTKKKGRKFCPELIYQVTDFLSNKIDATYYQGTQQCPTRKWLLVTTFAGTVIISLLYILF